MKFRTSKALLGILVVGLVIVFGASSAAMGQRRGRRVSHWDNRCEKFVNCHDARDGRWDGRGPNRRTGFTNTFRRHRWHRDRYFDRISRRDHFRNRDWQHNRWRRWR